HTLSHPLTSLTPPPSLHDALPISLALRQPGSSIKPIIYATAFEMGWYPAMILQDHKTIYPTRVADGYYTPQNYDGHFHTGFPMTDRKSTRLNSSHEWSSYAVFCLQ